MFSTESAVGLLDLRNQLTNDWKFIAQIFPEISLDWMISLKKFQQEICVFFRWQKFQNFYRNSAKLFSIKKKSFLLPKVFFCPFYVSSFSSSTPSFQPK
jgi:hypothetical protein